MFESFSEPTRRALFFARYEASKRGAVAIEPEHLLLGVLREDEEGVGRLLAALGVEAEALRRELEGGAVVIGHISSTADLPLSELAGRIVDEAAEEAAGVLAAEPRPVHLLLAVLRHEDCAAARLLAAHGAGLERARAEARSLEEEERRRWTRSGPRLLPRFGRDLTELAAQGRLDPLVGREQELERIVEVLARRRKNSALLLGDPGVGKTAIVEGLAQRLATGAVPLCMRGRRLWSVEISALLAGTRYRGQFEERLRELVREIAEDGRVLVFFDEIHSLVGAGGGESALDAANVLKPALARGELTVIGATTPADYLKHIEKDRSLERRFEVVRVEAPSREQSVRILAGLRDRYASFHGVRYPDETLRTAVDRADRYLAERRLPDKAVDLIDQAGARVKVRLDAGGSPSVEPADVDAVVARATGIPVERLGGGEAERLAGMEGALRRRVVGQDRAIGAVARAVRRSRLGVADPTRPVGSFLFLGPPGVGKTEVARALAGFLFGTEDALVRFDMSELMERHAVSRLIGAPPGYVGYEEGGRLTEAVRRRPYSLVLFDEIEKAHPQTVNLLLQVLEDGVLTDSLGHHVDFRHTLLLMTSNAGSRLLAGRASLGFGGDDAEVAAARVRDTALEELKKTFSPEFVDRLDEVVVFNPLHRPELLAIVDLLLEDTNRVLAGSGVSIRVAEGVREWLLAESGADGSQGARPLRRTIQRCLHDAVSEVLIRRPDGSPTVLRADVVDGALELEEVREPELVDTPGGPVPAEHG